MAVYRGMAQSDSAAGGSDIPKTSSDLDAHHLLDLDSPNDGYQIGDELWVPVSPIRGDRDRFRAMKIKIVDMESTDGYERHHALHRKDVWLQHRSLHTANDQ